MKSFEYKITDMTGIHARPAGLLVKLSKSFKSKLTMQKDEKNADCKGLFSIMGLNVKFGDKITISAEGEDEDLAISKLTEFFENNL